MEERIVCAANRDKFGDIILGVRHHDNFMNHAIGVMEEAYHFSQDFYEQGFITNKGRFVDRQEAWSIACKNNQIVRRVGGDKSNGGTLYSENLY